MTMKRTVLSLALLALASIFTVRQAAADSVLYNTVTTSSYKNNGFRISQTQSVTDSFTLTAPSTVDGFNFGEWIGTSAGLPVSVDWAVTTAPYGGSTLASGAATGLSSTYVAPFGGYYIYNVGVTIPSLSLQAGTTYWLQLSNAEAQTSGTSIFWDDAALIGYNAYRDTNGTISPSNTNTFEILGSPTATNTNGGGTGPTTANGGGTPLTSVVPEPGSLLLMASGMLGMLGAFKTRLLA